MAIFANCNIALAGTFKGRKQADIQFSITSNGGTYSAAVTPGTTTHLITNISDVAKRGPKVKVALDKSNNVTIVGIDWLDKCLEEGKQVDETEYILNLEEDEDGDIEMADSQATNGSLRRSARSTSKAVASSQDAVPAPQPATALAAGKKRGRQAAKTNAVQEEPEAEEVVQDKDEDQVMKDTEEEEKPAKKARSGKAAATAAASATVPVPTSAASAPVAPAPKRGRGVAKTASQIDTAAAPAPTPAPTKKGRGKKKETTAAPDAEEDKEETKDDKKDDKEKKGKDKEDKPPVKMKTVKMAKGKAPVDEFFPDAQNWEVYVDKDGVIFDGTLNQTDIGKNSNKFYYVQLLYHPQSGGYATWTRWGRVGESGATSIVAPKNSTLSNAMYQFEKKFKDKTGLSWANRFDEPKARKYTYVLKNYAESDDEDDEENGKGKGKGKGKDKKEENEEPPIPESKIHEALQKLMSLIFNTNIMQQQLVSMSYDSNKLPLGKLSKSTLNQGFLVLKAIGDLLNNPSLAQSQHHCSPRDAFIQLTNRYYSVIPHAFGRNVPPVINSPQMLKKEVELIESLGDMQIASEVIKNTKAPRDEDGNPINPIDQQFQSLRLEEAIPLDKKSGEFKNLEGYLKRTHGKTHHVSLKVEEIFRIERQGETQRFKDAGYDTLPNDNRYLLWHGSRVTNFAGILSQGLRIAPPEAPVNGYMFGKGIYLADMVTKSANYCCAFSSDQTGLLLLCEAQLGNPMFELVHADYHAAENSKKAGALATKGKGRTAPTQWMDAGIVHDDLKGVKMPDIKAHPGDIDERGLYLQYNEYIVYNVAQVKLRYLFRCKFQ
ncbi:poly polymerase catalytic domain-containing protein [Kalaharituber pfeilii]|nr:poly polymerase catalytic domain-containing protein [Kalaharituber pfeilii]